MRDFKLLFVSIFALLACNATFAQTDEEIDAANAAIENNGVYRIYTLFNGSTIGTTKYYLTADGYLTDQASEAKSFIFLRATGGSYAAGKGYKLNQFTNGGDGSNNITSDAQKHIVVGSNNRDDFEGQVFFLNAEGNYAVRSTNSNSTLWAASAFWTVVADNDQDKLPNATYTMAGADYIWRLEQDEFKAQQIEAYNTASSWITTIQSSNGLVKDASNYISNAKDPSEGSYEALLDGDYKSFFHSTWHTSNDPQADHYLQATLGQAAQKFYFYFKKRSQNNNNRPTQINIAASNDGENFFNITSITEGLPTSETVIEYLSDVVDLGAAYKYVRFSVSATNTGAMTGNHVFFTFSEFYILPSNAGVDNVIALYKKLPSSAFDLTSEDITAINDATANLFSTVDAQLTADSLVIDAGEEGLLDISLTKADETWTAYQFALTLPNGISLDTNEEGEYLFELSSRHSSSHNLTIKQLSDNTYSIVCYSPQSTPLTDDSGLLLKLHVKADVSAKGQVLHGSITNISFSDENGVETALVDTSFGVSVVYPIITINDATREYGDSNPTFTYTASGSATLRGEPLLTTTATATSPVTATYPISAERGTIENAYYEVTPGTLTVTKAPLIIAVNDNSKVQGEPNPQFTVTYSGFKNGENEEVLTEKAVAATEADASSLPGTYAITVSGAEAQNYEITYVNGTLTVLSLPSYTILYGDMSFFIPDVQIHEVILTSVDDKPHVVVPSSVQYQDQEWTVTSLADSVFAENIVLVTVEIPATITSVGKDVFDNCPHLAAIVWRSPVKMTGSMMGHFSNKNLLLYVADKETALSGVPNVIDLSTLTATQIVLTDEGSSNDFYCPIAFTATDISYSHEYNQTTLAGSSQGWDALALPFDVASVSHEQKGEVHPFATLTDDQILSGQRPFWLCEYSAEGFKKASRIAANTPYIISLPNEALLWDDYILGGKVTFQATNATVQPTAEAAGVSNGGRTFHPSFRREEGADSYVLNVGSSWEGHAEGSVFVQGLRATRPFEACFTSTSDAKAFRVMDEQTDDIRSIMPLAESLAPVFDLSGRKVKDGNVKSGDLRRGVYIVGGRKYIKW